MSVLGPLQSAGDLLAIAEPADLMGARLLQRSVEVAIKVIIAAEVHVLQSAGVRVDALRHQRLKSAFLIDGALAGQQDLPHLIAQRVEAGAVPLIGKRSLYGVAD